MTVYIKQNSLIVNTYFLLVLRFVFQEHGGFTWRVSDCEELVDAELLIMFVLIVSLKWHRMVPLLVPLSSK